MATKHKQMLHIIHMYKEQTGNKQVDMREVAKFATEMGWPLPKPIDPLDRLAREFADAAREEIRHDKKTGRPYRGNHAVWTTQGENQFPLWIDIDESHPRKIIVKSLMKRREQTVGDLLQLTFDAEHWNNMHPNQEPITIPCDLTDDVEWRKNGHGEDEKAG